MTPEEKEALLKQIKAAADNGEIHFRDQYFNYYIKSIHLGGGGEDWPDDIYIELDSF